MLIHWQHRYFVRQAHQARKVEHFYFDLTCDVISDLNVKISPCSVSASNGVLDLEIGLVVCEISRGHFAPPPSAGRVLTRPQRGES